MTGNEHVALERRLRILMVAPTSFFADYGCHVRILEEVRALQERGHRVLVCTYHNGNDVPGIEIRRSIDVPWLQRAEVGSSRHKAYLDIALCWTTLRNALRFQPDIIHGHLHEGALIGSVVGRLLRRPVVFDYQGSLTEEMLDHHFVRPGGKRERFFRWLERRIDRLPDAIVPSGVAGVRYLRGRVPAERVTLVPDGVDVCRFDPDAWRDSAQAFRERLGIPATARVVVYLGLLAEYQGTGTLVRAAARLLRERDDVFVVVAGYPAVETYAQLARELGVAERVLFPGRIPYAVAPGLLAAGDVAVAPKVSTTEGNGKLLNYMAMGLPVVATDTPTNRAILGERGLLFPPGDDVALARALAQALDEPREAGMVHRRRVVEQFSWPARVRDIERVYANVLGRQAARSVASGAEPAPGD